MFTRPVAWSSVTAVVPVAVPVEELPVESPRLPVPEPGPYGQPLEPWPRPRLSVGAGDALPAMVVADDVPTPTRTPPATPAAASVAAIATRLRRRGAGATTGCQAGPTGGAGGPDRCAAVSFSGPRAKAPPPPPTRR